MAGDGPLPYARNGGFQHQEHIMKPQYLKNLFASLQLHGKSVKLAKHGQHSEESRGKTELLGDEAQEAGVLHALGRPSEEIFAALVARDAGDPSMFNQLVKEGYVFGTLKEARALWHKMSKRDGPRGSFSREEVANASPEAAAREAAVANALDPAEAIDFSESADGWFKISPYGVFRGKTPGRPQHVSVDNAKAMEGEFNSMLGTLGRMFRGIPIYHGHPDVDPEIWPDDRRIGKITKLDARADGLWGFAEWNSLGDQNKAEGWWIYPSPRWDSPKGQKNFSPDRLISIGLTNTPRIEDSEPVFNTLLENETEPNQPMDPKVIRQKLGLAPESTDEEVLTKLDAVIAAATKAPTQETELANAKTDLACANAKKDELACAVTARDNTIVSLREAHNNSLLDSAEKETRITPAERPAWLAKLNGSNREAEINSLNGLKPRLNTKGIDLANRRDERAQSDNLREQVANAVAKLQKDDGLSYDAAWQKVKKQAEYKPYFSRTEA